MSKHMRENSFKQLRLESFDDLQGVVSSLGLSEV